MPLFHFILIYNTDLRKLVSEVERFVDVEDATAKFVRLENGFEGKPHLQVILVGADSIDTIRETHPHYFGNGNAVEDYLATTA